MTWNPLDIYARAARRLKLTPGERAALKTVDTLLVASLAGALLAVAQAALSGGAPLSFHTLAQIGEYAFVTALLTGLVKLFRASGDAAFVTLGSAIEGVASRLPQPAAVAPPTTQPYSPRPSGGAPSGPLPSRQERLASLSGAGYRSFGDPSTRPTATVAAATSAPRTPAPTPPPSSPVVAAHDTLAPSQAQFPPSAVQPPIVSVADDDGDGPPTVVLPAVTAAKQDAFLR